MRPSSNQAKSPNPGAPAIAAPKSPPKDGAAITSSVNSEQGDHRVHGEAARATPHREPGEQQHRGSELRERDVALARHPDPDGRRIAEHGVELEARAGEEVAEVQHDGCRQRKPQRQVATPPAEESHASANTTAAPTRNAKYPAESSRAARSAAARPAYVAKRNPSTASARNRATAARRRLRRTARNAASASAPLSTMMML